ncbi:hypothetical protein PQ469_15970 [Mucilaginibacter sp. KACC 22773]|uniref:hypothetical protein n=1 Tax=Mucilaginibacter sp. KACC 22773 TaxID=3025671 RepID=UPI002366922C|nr:hypothetical protein [Mucilaginibacter sp. KACC 22773]WDF75388.1 hypothetical protein PQ469_15970 [Mucilaginibacter sp. KACC 22773]
MDINFDHNKLLKKITKQRLSTYGIVQKGTSRTFLKDHGWYTIVIEFQPSGFGKGTYLNVGVDLNFYPQQHLSFSYDYRQKEFREAKNEDQYTEIVIDFCNFAIKKTQKLETDFSDIGTAIETVKKSDSKELWNKYNLAILYGLMGNLPKSRRLLNEIREKKYQYDYEFERQKVVISILTCMDEFEPFINKIQDIITQTRALKKLPVYTLENLTEVKTKRTISERILSFFDR